MTVTQNHHPKYGQQKRQKTMWNQQPEDQKYLYICYIIYIYNIDILIDLSWPILDALHFLLG